MFANFLSAALLIAAALPALAGDDVPLPPITPVDGFFVMTQDDATTTSKCIGDPKTPLCAVETLLVCFLRREPDLCETAEESRLDPGFREAYFERGRPPEPPRIYWVVRREILSERTLPWPPRELENRPGEVSMQAGDVRIDIVDKVCHKGEISHTACETNPYGSAIVAYIVRQLGDRWAVIDWRPPYEDLPQLR